MIVLASPAVSRLPMTPAVAGRAIRPDWPVATNTRLHHHIYTHRACHGNRKGSGARMLGRQFLRRGTSKRTSTGGMPALKRGSTHMRIAETTLNLRVVHIEKVCTLSSYSRHVFSYLGGSSMASAVPRSVCCVPRIPVQVGVGLVPWFLPNSVPRSTLGKFLRQRAHSKHFSVLKCWWRSRTTLHHLPPSLPIDTRFASYLPLLSSPDAFSPVAQIHRER